MSESCAHRSVIIAPDGSRHWSGCDLVETPNPDDPCTCGGAADDAEPCACPLQEWKCPDCKGAATAPPFGDLQPMIVLHECPPPDAPGTVVVTV